jgi:hypothetical protein
MNLDDVATECRLRQASRAHFIGGMNPEWPIRSYR